MRKLIYIMAFITSFSLWAQQPPEKPATNDIQKFIEKGLQAYTSADYEKAELNFRKALAKDPLNAVAAYDLGLTKAEQENELEALRFFKKSAKASEDKLLKSKAYFNEGNIWYNKKKYEKAVEAYKNALRNNPGDEEARYNLALAMQKIKKQNKNKQNKQNKDKNKDQKNKDKNKQNQDKNKQNKDQKDKNKKDQKNKDNKDKKDQNKQNNKDKKNDKGNKDKKDKDQKGKDKKDKDKNGKDKKDKKDKNGKDKKDKKDDKKGDKKDKKDGEQGKDKKKQEGEKGNQPKNQQGQGGKRKVKLTPQQVKQLLIALKNKEQKTQKKVKAKVVKAKAGKKKQDKDW